MSSHPDEPEDVKGARIAAARFCRGKNCVKPEEVLGLAWIAHQRSVAKGLYGHAKHTSNARGIIDQLRAEDNHRRKHGRSFQHDNEDREDNIPDPRPFETPDEVQELWAGYSRRFAREFPWQVRVALYLALVEGFRVEEAAAVVGCAPTWVWLHLKKFRAAAERSRDL